MIISIDAIIGNDDHAILAYQYGYPKIQPYCVVALFEAHDDLILNMCQLWVADQYTEKNCNLILSFVTEDI